MHALQQGEAGETLCDLRRGTLPKVQVNRDCPGAMDAKRP